jgi:hypothetical protein
MFTKSRTESEDPILAKAYTLTLEPSRKNERRENADPMVKKSSTLKLLARYVIP